MGEEFKKYSVFVDGGSGCLFQPADENYSYVITARHVLGGEIEDVRGQEKWAPYEDGTDVKIGRWVQEQGKWLNKPIPFILQTGITYFPHKTADIAILKIDSLDNLDAINVQQGIGALEGTHKFNLCGYPASIRGESDNFNYIPIAHFGARHNESARAQLNPLYNLDHITGYSGGGLLRMHENGVSVLGIQSKMVTANLPAGSLDYVPISFAEQIIEYPENAGKLAKLFHPGLRDFTFLKQDAFKLNVDAFYKSTADAASIILRNMARNIIASDVTPEGIRKLFHSRLLVFEKDHECLGYRNIWIAWLEFLTIMNFIKYEKIDEARLSEIFNCYRLKYVDIDDWTAVDIKPTYGNTDYTGLKIDGIVFIGSRKSPTNAFKLNDNLIDIDQPFEKDFKTDRGINPFTSFKFYHLDIFKVECISQKIKDYHKLNETEILNKLKIEYDQLFA